MKRKILLFIVMTIFMTIFTYFFHLFTGDELWNYGFSYNIAKGTIPYRDFNMIVMPFYSLIMAIPLKIIGNNLFIYYLFNAIFISLILTIMDDGKTLNSIFMSIIIALLMNSYGYNCFITILLIFVLYIENSEYKYKNEMIGLLLGCILATKQNIGALLFIPYFFHSKNKLKSICCYLLPISIIMVYLILNHALIECIDYCFLGLKNFTSNFIIKRPMLIILEFLIVIYLIKGYIKTKNINYFYLLCFQFISYPLMDLYHFSIGLIPVIYYWLCNEENKYTRFVIYILFIFLFLIPYTVFEYEDFELSSIDSYQYKLFTKGLDNTIKNTEDFINKNADSRVFIFTNFSYLIKISMNEKIDKFDLINKGNMGYNEEKYIEDMEKICKKKNCLFIINEDIFGAYGSQMNPIIKNYVVENYDYCGNITEEDSLYCQKNTE